jgi:hypothetical protein
MAKNYLDKTGLAYLWNKIKAYIDNRINSIVNGDEVKY